MQEVDKGFAEAHKKMKEMANNVDPILAVNLIGIFGQGEC
jgi:hypothetical protein